MIVISLLTLKSVKIIDMKLRYEPPVTKLEKVEVEGAICEASLADIRPGDEIETGGYMDINEQSSGGNFVFEEDMEWE